MKSDRCGSEEMRPPAQLPRRVFDPLHYLALLERKTNALDQAPRWRAGSCPNSFTCLRRLLEARLGKPGKRELQVLRLLEDSDSSTLPRRCAKPASWERAWMQSGT